MNVAAPSIRAALARVDALRSQRTADGALREGVTRIKALQRRRFASTYADLLADAHHRAAVWFFLNQLYGEQEFTSRDAQFARIAAPLEALFPQKVAAVAALVADLHARTETLDQQMAGHWVRTDTGGSPELRYVQAWRSTGQREQRDVQLTSVLSLGHALQDFSQNAGLKTLLRWMRKPAATAGLAELQNFLESGLGIFSALGSAETLLDAIAQRERSWLTLLFDASLTDATDGLIRALSSRHDDPAAAACLSVP